MGQKASCERDDNIMSKKWKWFDSMTTANLPLIKPCHKGNVYVFTDPVSKIRVHGGGWYRDVTARYNDLQLSLTSDYITANPITTINLKAQVIEGSQDFPAIKIDWPDGGIPELTPSDWELIVKEIRLQAKNYKRLIVYCQGGHGRTGTALAILGSLMGAIKENPVEYVRRSYCKKAIETMSQLNYIQAITGADVSKAKEEYRANSKREIGYGSYGGRVFFPAHGNFEDFNTEKSREMDFNNGETGTTSQKEGGEKE